VIESPGFFWTVLFFLLAIGPLIFVHELGHYLVARWLGVKSEVFSIGFGQEIVGWTDKRGTRWKIGWMPLGGYVKFAGDMNAASMPDDQWQALPEAQRNVTFPAQPVWKRFLIVLAGPVTNLIAAVLIFMGIIASVGELRVPPVIGQIAPKSAAAESGFKAGDRIVSINGREIERFQDIGHFVELRPKELLDFTLIRDGRTMTITAAPKEDTLKDRFGNVYKRGLLGVGPASGKRVEVPLLELPGAGLRMTGAVLTSMIDGLGQIITGKRSMKEMGGPLMIAKFSGESAALGWIAFFGFMALISINLGFINLLPVPMLDGGHLLFQIVEALRGKPVSPQIQEKAFFSGFVLLMALMLFVTVNDLGRFGLFGAAAG
jgi:regulator of sigma E protease